MRRAGSWLVSRTPNVLLLSSCSWWPGGEAISGPARGPLFLPPPIPTLFLLTPLGLNVPGGHEEGKKEPELSRDVIHVS